MKQLETSYAVTGGDYTPRLYTLAEMDRANYTETGRALFNRLPVETRNHPEMLRIAGLCALLARNGAQAWNLGEESNSLPDWARRSHENQQRWEEDLQKRTDACDSRVVGLVVALNELTGQGWKLGGAVFSWCLVIPEGLTEYRSDYTYHTPGDGRSVPAIFLGGK